ncbi:MAG: DUF3226 domain-containing protein [Cyclobacteriaceae bacterium]
MTKTLLIVEGVADAVFVTCYLKSILGPQNEVVNIKKFIKGEKTIICNKPDLNIFIAGGCTHVKQFRTSLRMYQDQGYKLLMIQDADNSEKDKANGGIVNRISFLNEIKSEFKIEFETFLFPDNKSDGDLEDILVSIANRKRFEVFFNCFNAYFDCVSNFAETQHVSELRENKSLIYNYCQVFTGKDQSNEKNRDYNSEFWNLNDELLTPFKTFLEEQIDI